MKITSIVEDLGVGEVANQVQVIEKRALARISDLISTLDALVTSIA